MKKNPINEKIIKKSGRDHHGMDKSIITKNVRMRETGMKKINDR